MLEQAEMHLINSVLRCAIIAVFEIVMSDQLVRNVYRFCYT